MIDPLTEVVSLLQPLPLFAKVVSGAGAWQVRRAEEGRPYYCVVVSGGCRLSPEGEGPVLLRAGDFVLIPSVSNYTMTSLEGDIPPDLAMLPTQFPNGEFRLGPEDEPSNAKLLVGYCTFGSPDAALLVSLLPRLVHIRGKRRLSLLVDLVVDETLAQRPAREVVLPRLMEVLLVEALRVRAETPDSPGLLRGLADERLAVAIRGMHADPAQAWTVERLANEATLSRSAFYERFTRALGMPPMEYLFVLRMALAKRLLRKEDGNVAAVAERVGYGSASAFSVAFARHVGMPPARYAKQPS